MLRVGRLGVGGGRAGRGDDLGRDDGGDQVRAGIGSHVEDGVDAVGEHGEGVLRHEQPDKCHCYFYPSQLRGGQEMESRRGKPTEILDVLIGEVTQSTAGLLCTRLLASAPCLVDHDAVCYRSSDEGDAVRELSNATVIVHTKPRERVAERRQDEGQMSAGG